MDQSFDEQNTRLLLCSITYDLYAKSVLVCRPMVLRATFTVSCVPVVDQPNL